MTPEEIVALYYGSPDANKPMLGAIRQAIAAAYEDAARIAESEQVVPVNEKTGLDYDDLIVKTHNNACKRIAASIRDRRAE
jgi:2-hydroxychromene-2-carboxylate isomerase